MKNLQVVDITASKDLVKDLNAEVKAARAQSLSGTIKGNCHIPMGSYLLTEP